MRVAFGGKAHAAVGLDIGLGVVERGALGENARRRRLDRIVTARTEHGRGKERLRIRR